MFKKVYINLQEINLIIIISVLTISFLLSSGASRILKFSSFQFFDESKYINLSKNLDYYIPKDNMDLDINQIINTSKSEFIKLNRKTVYFPGDVNKVWLKLNLQSNQADINNVLYIDCVLIQNLQFYIPTKDNKYISIKPKEYFISPYIDFPENTDFNKDIYINLTWDSNVFNLLLAKDSDFYINQNWLTSFYVINFGILYGMIIMNIVLYFSSKDSKYLFHSLFTASLISLLYCLSGMQRPIFGFTNNNRLIALGAMASSTWLLFIYSYLDIKNNMPKLNNFFKISIAALILSLYSSALVPNGYTYDILYLYLFITGLCFIFLLYSFFKFNLGSIYYLTGIFILFIGVMLFILSSYGLIAWNMITFNACYIAASIETLLFTIGIIKQIKRAKEKNEKLQVEVVTDKLTNLYNRRYFEETVKEKIDELEKENANVTMLIIDIDHFKSINDTYGHNVGDSVLSETANLINQCLGKDDISIRWGGEEFVVILPYSDILKGKDIAERIRRRIDNNIFTFADSITVSIGAAEKATGESFDTWFKRVDNAMYEAKESGRNRVVYTITKNIVDVTYK